MCEINDHGHTCDEYLVLLTKSGMIAQVVQITRTANNKVNSSQCYDYIIFRVYLLQNNPWV
jgi:hypothetical protein